MKIDRRVRRVIGAALLLLGGGVTGAAAAPPPEATVEKAAVVSYAPKFTAENKNKFKDMMAASARDADPVAAPAVAWKRVAVAKPAADGIAIAGVESGVEGARVVLTKPGLDVITAKVLPRVAKAEGMDRIEIADQKLTSGSFKGVCKGTWKLVLRDIDLRMPLDSNDVKASFPSGNKISVSLDQDGAYFKATVAMVIDFSDACILAPDKAFDLVKATFSVRHLTAEVGATLDSGGNALGLKSIDKLEVKIGAFDLANAFWNAVVDFGFSIAKVFGSSCGSVEACINAQAARVIRDNGNFQDKLLGAIDKALGASVQTSGSATVSGIKLSAAVTGLVTEGGNLVAQVSLGAENAGTRAACSSALTWTQDKQKATSLSYGGDLDAIVPLWFIEKLLFVVGEQGTFCHTQSGAVPGVAQTTYKATIAPKGMIDVTGSGLGSDVRLKVKVPIGVHTELSVSLPIGGAGKAGTTVTKDLDGAIAFTLKVLVKGGGLEFALEEVTLSGLSGQSIPFQGNNVDLGPIEALIKQRLGEKLAALRVPILDRLTKVNDYVSISLKPLSLEGGVIKTAADISLDLN